MTIHVEKTRNNLRTCSVLKMVERIHKNLYGIHQQSLKQDAHRGTNSFPSTSVIAEQSRDLGQDNTSQ